jgi:NAD(P)-dependent dehydrogenase (short-subunit alcohol dehydrogenase family)
MRVVITGSNRGIGLELVRVYRARGDEVVALCRQGSPSLMQTGAQVVEACDVTAPDLADRVKAHLGERSVDLAILNAGVLSSEPLEDLHWARMRRQWEVNALGPLRCAEALLGHLAHGSKIGIITSRMGSMADNTSGGMYGYRMSKAAVNMAGRCLAMDLQPRGIAVQLLHPGFVRTEMTGGNGLIDPDHSAQTLAERLDELTLETTGTFRHQNGEWLPW